MKIRTKTETVISVHDWDTLVEETYKRHYNFQQQDGCKERGRDYISVPTKDPEDYENDSVEETVNGDEMGVSFKAWLERDPKQKLSDPDCQNEWSIEMWWQRNFYPHVSMIANDLYSKGLIEKGEYVIDIDW